MKIKTICAWCGGFISETNCPETKNFQALAKDGVMISHGLCPACRLAIETKYGLNKKGDDKNV
ncbi:hypothetical protein [Desulfobacter sp. UBA2225]|uniref:hypothetical protein n=1 Tax=Desulfobacter sp. UBA2225 TaxID=1961413 RepID=UPI00257CD580|nr:hypothetical protein [Desulfobacter sp. UBA2225]